MNITEFVHLLCIHLSFMYLSLTGALLCIIMEINAIMKILVNEKH